MHIDQQAHQLGHGDGWMRVVELDRLVLGQAAQVPMLLQMPARQVLQRGGGEEIFLPQPQFLPGGRGVARIQQPRNRLGAVALGHGADMVAAVEGR